jgi:N-acetylglutamate synthase/N-acetylornithine aminotransferase
MTSHPITQDAVALLKAALDEDSVAEALKRAGLTLVPTQSLSEWRDSPELVERVARAIAEVINNDYSGSAELLELMVPNCRRYAKAAIAAIPPGSEP